MRCPFCGHLEDKVVDSREGREGDSIRRRRECLSCHRRFTSYERVEEIPLYIVKKDGRREFFDPKKLLNGMQAACQKRPVSMTQLEELVRDIHAQIIEQPDREIRSLTLGEMAMNGLKSIDSVAYVRFASVYREFKDLSDFVKSVEALVGSAKNGTPSRVDAKKQAIQSTQIQTTEKAVQKSVVEKTETPIPLFPGEITNAISKKRKT